MLCSISWVYHNFPSIIQFKDEIMGSYASKPRKFSWFKIPQLSKQINPNKSIIVMILWEVSCSMVWSYSPSPAPPVLPLPHYLTHHHVSLCFSLNPLSLIVLVCSSNPIMWLICRGHTLIRTDLVSPSSHLKSLILYMLIICRSLCSLPSTERASLVRTEKYSNL